MAQKSLLILVKEIESRIDNHKVTENHIIKKTNNTYLNILCQIPGISNKTALVIIDKYPTLPNLLKNLSVLDIKLNKNVLDNLKNTFDE